MLNESQKRLMEHVVLSLAKGHSNVVDESLIDQNITLFSRVVAPEMPENEIEQVRNVIKSECRLKLDKGTLINEPEHHEKWFKDRKGHIDQKYWDRYTQYLLHDKLFSPTIVYVMDDILDTLTDLLGDPERDCSYKRRGLIIGDVQSGKTANYTGLICKAVDAGYKVVVLLTGMIEKLRSQTQARIDEGFVGRDSDSQTKFTIDIGVGKYDNSIHPVSLTSISNDFKQNNATNLNFDLTTIKGAVIFVVKKNSSVLKRLNKWLKTFNRHGDKPIDDSILVIDDEADNASINTKLKEETPTAINGQIRALLNNFTKSSYVGFTATPFANVFIDPDNYDEMLEEDLFPKDYIYALNAPSNYIGARDIFSENASFSSMIEKIDDDTTHPNSIENLLPLKHKRDVSVENIPDDLKRSIEVFILSNVIQDIDENRHRNNTHRSMLINVSRFSAIQESVSLHVNEYLKNLQRACKLYCKLSKDVALKDPYISRLYCAYSSIYKNISEPLDWTLIQENLYISSASISVVTVNQNNKNNLDYKNYKNGLRVIAVGGLSLSRGLTLEGLVVSYFYRNSTMYDTLMQMGRWFGYRPGYADLCKIWMSEESIEWYRHISEATDELKAEVRRYQDSGLTPQDFGLRVRADLTTLLVTSRNKMQCTEKRECIISLSGETIETPEILSDRIKNEKNLISIKAMIDDIRSINISIKKINSGHKSRFGYLNVPSSVVLDLLDKIEVSPKNEEFNPEIIGKFIREYEGEELKKWDIVFATGESDKVVDILGPDYIFHNIRRKFTVENGGKIFKIMGSKRRLGTSSDGCFCILEGDIQKAKEIAFQRAKLWAEEKGKTMPKIEEVNPRQKDYFSQGIVRNPLLTIYLVTLSELCKDKTTENLAIFNECKERFFIGFGIGIPTLANEKTKYARYVLNKVAMNQLFDEDAYNSIDDEDGEVMD